MEFGLKDRTTKQIISVFLSFPEVEEVFVFGSRAKGNFKNGSDIDLALKGKKCTAEIAMCIEAILNEELPLPYKFDVVNYSTISNPDFTGHIDRVGKVFYRKEEHPQNIKTL